MLLARVIGHVVATRKDTGLHAEKLLVIQPHTPDGLAFGDPLVAVDGARVGVGEEVFYVRGREASFVFLPKIVPADASIVGKVDCVALREHRGGITQTSGSRARRPRVKGLRRDHR